MSALKWINLGLRAVVMEAGIVAAFAYWGYESGSDLMSRLALAIVAPLLGFGVWGTVDFRFAGRWSEPLRLGEELLISGLAALALVRAGQPALGAALALVSVVHHGLVYTSSERLVRQHRQLKGGWVESSS